MSDPKWKFVRHGNFGWNVEDEHTVAALWLQDVSFADASARSNGAISERTAKDIRLHLADHAASMILAPAFLEALASASLMAFRIAEDKGGGAMVVLQDGLVSTAPIGRLTEFGRGVLDAPDWTVRGADVEANIPGVRRLFADTKAHVLATLDPSLAAKIAPIADRGSAAWEVVLSQVSRQTLECFGTGQALNGGWLLPKARLLVVATVLPCAREALAELFRDLVPPSDHPYISFMLNLVNAQDSNTFDYLVHSIIACNPENRRMSLQLGIFPNAIAMKSGAPRILPLEVVTSAERKALGI